MTQKKDAWWKPVALLMLVIAFGMDLLVWQLSGGVEFSTIAQEAIRGFILAFGGTSIALLTISLGSLHRHSQWKEQITGLLLLSVIALYLAYSEYGRSIDGMRGRWNHPTFWTLGNVGRSGTGIRVVIGIGDRKRTSR